MGFNDNAQLLLERVALEFIASKLAPTKAGDSDRAHKKAR